MPEHTCLGGAHIAPELLLDELLPDELLPDELLLEAPLPLDELLEATSPLDELLDAAFAPPLPLDELSDPPPPPTPSSPKPVSVPVAHAPTNPSTHAAKASFFAFTTASAHAYVGGGFSPGSSTKEKLSFIFFEDF